MVKQTKLKAIIIGGGTCGVSIASELAEKFDVTILEQSNIEEAKWLYKIPLGIGLAIRDPKQRYVKNTTIDVSQSRNIPFYQSKLLGGASVINGCVHTVGGKKLWSKTLKKFEISQKEFEKALHSSFRLNHKSKNPDVISLSMVRKSSLDIQFIQAAESLGIKSGDIVWQDEEAVGSIVNNSGRVFRSSVLDLLRKKNVNVCLGTTIDKLSITKEGKITSISTNHGTFNGAFFILAGGVEGSSNLLRKVNIQYGNDYYNKSALGRGIADHVNFRINIKSKKPYGSINEIWNNRLKQASLAVRHVLGERTILGGTGATSAINLDLNKDGIVDTRINLIAYSEASGHYLNDTGRFDNGPGFSLSISTIDPKSRGTINWKENRQKISPNYLNHADDQELAKLGLFKALEIAESEAMSEFVDDIPEITKIKLDPEAYIKETFQSGHHLIGGVTEIVTSEFKIGTFKNFYVCDASVLPSFPASNIHAPVILLGKVLAGRLLEEKF